MKTILTIAILLISFSIQAAGLPSDSLVIDSAQIKLLKQYGGLNALELSPQNMGNGMITVFPRGNTGLGLEPMVFSPYEWQAYIANRPTRLDVPSIPSSITQASPPALMDTAGKVISGYSIGFERSPSAPQPQGLVGVYADNAATTAMHVVSTVPKAQVDNMLYTALGLGSKALGVVGGVAGATAAVLSSPVWGGVAAISTAGMLGYEIYSGLCTAGWIDICPATATKPPQVQPSGSPQSGNFSCASGASIAATICSYGGCYFSASGGDPASVCASLTTQGWNVAGYMGRDGCHAMYLGSDQGAMPTYMSCSDGTTPSYVPPPSIAITDDKIKQYIAQATAASAAALADAFNLAQKAGVQPDKYVSPSVQIPTPVNIHGDWKQVSSQIDPFTGNETLTYSRSVAELSSPSSPSSSPAVRGGVQTVSTSGGRMVSGSTSYPDAVAQPVPSSLPSTISQTGTYIPAQSKTQLDLCATSPNILACADTSNTNISATIPTKTIDVAAIGSKAPKIQGGLAVCPAPIVLPRFGVTIDLWKPFCNFARDGAPLVRAVFGISALMIIFGFGKKGGA